MTNKKGNVLAIGIMFFLFAMVSFVTGLQNPMGVIAKAQFGATNAMSQLGNLANFIAYAFMGLPAGFLLKGKGYKFTALAAIVVGFVGVGISYLSGVFGSFAVYLLGAFVSGFSMCMLNTVVNPMLNTLGGGGNRGNQLIQLGGSCNSLSATIVPVFAGYLIGEITGNTQVSDVNPALFLAMGIFAVAFLIIFFSYIPEPELEAGVKDEESTMESIKGAVSHKNLVFGIIAIFLYVGVEVGIPNVMNLYLTDVNGLNIATAVA
jgi:FHS family L-fucose permease-like MFS transporter